MTVQQATGSMINKTLIENIGAKRIYGADLLTKGKFPFWVFWIEEISNLAVWEGTTASSDKVSWMGGLGYAVAGDTATRDTLSPFEGQKYYNTDTDEAEFFTGGGWSGVPPVGTPQPVSARYITPVVGAVLTSGKHHHLKTTGDYLIPNGVDDSQVMRVGQDIAIAVSHGAEVVLKTQGTSQLIASTGENLTEIALKSGAYYALVYRADDKFEITDAIDLPFATDVEAADRSVDNKVIAPSNLIALNMDLDDTDTNYPEENMQVAFNYIDESILFNTSNIYAIVKASITTGLVVPTPELTVTAISTAIVEISTTPEIYYETLVPSTADDRTEYIKVWPILQFDVRTITDMPTDGIYFRWLGYDDAGNLQVFQEAPLTRLDIFTVCRLLLSKSGTDIFLSTGDESSIQIRPNFANYDDERRVREPLKVEVALGPNADLTFNTAGGKIFGESVNYTTDYSNPHALTVSIEAAVVFGQVSGGTAGNPILPAPGTIVDVTQYWNGVALQNVNGNDATVIRILITTVGTWIVQYGEAVYNDLADAENAIAIAPFTDLFNQNDAQELARIAVRGDATDFTDVDDAVWRLATSNSGGISTPTALSDNPLLNDPTVAASTVATTTLSKTLGSVSASRFFALAEKRIRDNAGSGFAEWGKHFDDITNVNQGIYALGTAPNVFYIGRGNSGSPVGVSRTNYPLAQVNGVQHTINQVNTSSDFALNNILVPPSPEGTKTYDSATGVVVQHADSATAFAAETAANKVIISRQDYVFLESWHEKVSDKDVVCPLGNVQYGSLDYKGITLTVQHAQGYSSFGEWDTTTVGYGAQWSTLSDAQKNIFLQDPDNNIYEEGGELIQVRYRVRVIEGLGDDWTGSFGDYGYNPQENEYMGYSSGKRGRVQGALITSFDFTVEYQDCFATGFGETAPTIPITNLGQYSVRNNHLDFANVAHNGLCFAVPIALVQRRNQAAYHPVYNPEGTSNFVNLAQSANGKWYTTIVADNKPNVTSDCFKPTSYRPQYGEISNGGANNGRSDGKCYDAIYASDVQDLRMSSKLLPKTEIREKYERDAIAGKVRGFEGVPWTVGDITETATTSSYVSLGQTKPSWWDSLPIKLPQEGEALLVLDSESVIISDGTNTMYGFEFGWTTGSNLFYFVRTTTLHGTGAVGTPWTGSNTPICISFTGQYAQQHSQANPTWTDIIGDPANIAATFPDGVEGQWIPQIPVGVSATFPLNRKSLANPITNTRTLDNGASWSSADLSINSTTNDFSGSLGSTYVALWSYETQAHFTQDDVNSEVLDLGDVYGSSYYFNNGHWLTSSLINKVQTGTTGITQRVNASANLKSYVITPDGTASGTQTAGALWGVAGGGNEPTHEPVNLDHETDTPACKTLDYLSSSNGVAKLCYAYKEMVYDASANTPTELNQINSGNSSSGMVVGELYYADGTINSPLGSKVWKCVATSGVDWNDTGWVETTKGITYQTTGTPVIYLVLYNTNGWGDNNKVEITDNQGTLTDNNGNTVLYGTASFNTQYFIVEE